MTKYRSSRTVIDGITFASKAEARRYCDLRLMEKAGVIRDLKLQPRFTLLDAFTDGGGQRHRAITYVADFQYIEACRDIVEDVKGMETPVFKLKRKLFLSRYPELVFKVTK